MKARAQLTRTLIVLLISLFFVQNIHAELVIKGPKAKELMKMIGKCSWLKLKVSATGVVTIDKEITDESKEALQKELEGLNPSNPEHQKRIQEINEELTWYAASKCSATFTKLVKDIIKSKKTVELTTVHNKATCLDAFKGNGKQDVDVEDLEGLPEEPPAAHPWATTRCQDIIHWLAEAFHGAKNAGKAEGKFKPCHEIGLKAENDMRADKGQKGKVLNHYGPNGVLITDYDNGKRDTHHYGDPTKPSEYKD
jgi:hypothetical protein